ncbi:MAG: L-threonylcarbamoyladenylate synthase [Eubacteriales bacterium]
MKTKICKSDEAKLNTRKEILDKAGQILKKGGLVAFPTETVYGLGADALNIDAAMRTYEAKGRPSDNPLIIHIANRESLGRIVASIPDKAALVAEHFWPGPLTLIFQKSELVPYGTTGGLETVAVRMPAHELARDVIEAGGGYISAPSANSSGRPSPTSAEHVAEDLSGKIDMIIDGGSVEIGVESTILDMTVEPPMILRPGAITKDMLEQVIGMIQVDQAILDADSSEAPKAPGMKYRHYAPKANLAIVEGEILDCVEAINILTKEQIAEGYKVGIIGTEETLKSYPSGVVKSIGTREEEGSIAHNLYKILREFDEEDVDYIYSEAFFGAGIGDAIMNRLLKAAGQKLIQALDIIK